mmetsp:Transcript_57626/g.162489  ORF Transcript_57626/g.162489 Transcript_57626/m.162489 type:complete len:211 (-) Transcript_57626:65-697(-)
MPAASRPRRSRRASRPRDPHPSWERSRAVASPEPGFLVPQAAATALPVSEEATSHSGGHSRARSRVASAHSRSSRPAVGSGAETRPGQSRAGVPSDALTGGTQSRAGVPTDPPTGSRSKRTTPAFRRRTPAPRSGAGASWSAASPPSWTASRPTPTASAASCPWASCRSSSSGGRSGPAPRCRPRCALPRRRRRTLAGGSRPRRAPRRHR